MVNNRSILELLKLVLNNVNSVESISIGGLCSLINELYDNGVINVPEHAMLCTYMKDNILEDKSCIEYWWPKYEIKPRKEWLETQIKILENDGK